MINTQELTIPKEKKVRMSEMYIQAFNVFSETFAPTLSTIYYPGSNADISPSETRSFQDSRIIYVDQDTDAIKALKKEGYEAYLSDAKEFDPGKVDLLLLLNFYEKEPLKYVAEKGYVICNDHWTGTLDEMLRQSDFKFVGVFIDGNQELRTDEETLREETLRINSQRPNSRKRNIGNLFVFKKSKPHTQVDV